MSETTTTTTEALPFIRNASPLRLKLMAMQPGETLDVKPKDLPPYCKTVKKLTTHIQNNYPLYFGVLKLSPGPGWRVVRVNTAEEAESFTPKRKKKKSTRQDEPVRLYNMTDADLMVLVFEKTAIANRDIADLEPRGVNPADLIQLDADARAFGAMPGDVQLQADEVKAVELKDAARNTMQDRLGNLRTMAENTFGTGSVDYRVYGFEGMANQPDNDLLRLAKTARKQGGEDQAAMAAWGCSPAFLDLLQTDIETFDTALTNVKAAEAARKKATVLRVKTGNALYVRLDQLCNTGKDVYRTISAAKHNDYFIYS